MILSILSLYKYDGTLFDGLTKHLPSPDKFPTEYDHVELPTIDTRQLAIRICAECSDLELLYPDLDTMKLLIDNFGYMHELPWQLLYNSMFYKYNPIWNKDGTITKTETETRDLTTSGNSTVDGTQTANSDTKTTNKEDVTDEGGSSNDSGVSAFDDTGFSPREHSEAASHNNRNSNGSGSVITGSDIIANDSSQYSDIESGSITRTYEDVERGNIGVTMTQDMLEKERSVAMFNVMDAIVEDFKKEFCLMIY